MRFTELPVPDRAAGSAAGPARRRGVLLLVVLSMLTLFMLLGVTYLVLAARTRATSRAFLKLEDDLTASSLKMKPLIREAAMQVMRGTTNNRSAIRYHDLLADKYGGGASQIGFQSAAFVAGGQLVRVRLSAALTDNFLAPYRGRVVTISGGLDDRKQTSVRIADAANVNGVSYIWLPRPPGMTAVPNASGTTLWMNSREYDQRGFGTGNVPGVGKTYLNDAALMPNRSMAFSATFDSASYTNSALSASNANEDYDAVDEQNMALAWPDGSVQSFVRPELFSLWVRDYVRRQQAMGLSDDVGKTQPQVEEVLRQAILAGVDRYSPAAPVNVGPFSSLGGLRQAQVIAIHALRRASVRPFPFDHYQDDGRTTDFAGRSLATLGQGLSPTTGGGAPLGDVDNDGDGIKESVWLDVGQGVTVLGDGKVVKPLFAIHCIDLGGRIALNADGSPVHAAETSILGSPAFAPRRKENNAGDVSFQPPTRLRGGLGFGPADVRLDAVLDANTENAVMYGLASPSAKENGVQRDTGAVVGRYGDTIGNSGAPALPGVPGVNDRRMASDALNSWTDRGVPVSSRWAPKQGVTDANNPVGLFVGGPSDMWGRLAVGVDHRGQPFYANRTSSWDLFETQDNPYELDLFRSRQSLPYLQSQAIGTTLAYVDQPFTAAELESILRPYDIDNAMALPPRLLSMAMKASGGIDAIRFAVTADNWDSPVVPGMADAASFLNDLTKLDPDLVAGLKMDLNRPFGDAFDNDGDGIIDEPRETLDAVAASKSPDAFGGTFTSASGTTSTTNWLLTRGDPPAAMPAQPGRDDDPHLRARQVFAYQLYNLLSALKTKFAVGSSVLRLFAVKTDVDDNSMVPVAVDPALNTGTNGDALKQDAANNLALAQWAVNVVDFMDPDAIMTPFRYATGTGNANVVWGCEYPDLMITETLAFHDRRTADTKGDPTAESTADYVSQYTTKYNEWVTNGRSGPGPIPGNPDGGVDTDDGDFDQVRIPEGSLFLELHGLRNPNSPNLPRELYSWDAASSSFYLDVGRVPAGATSIHPVWRFAITDARTKKPLNDVFKKIADNPDTMPLTTGTQADKLADKVDIDRYVWLSATAPSASGTGPTLDNTYYRRDGSLPAPKLKPGGYLVVGPRPTTAIGSIDNGSAAAGQKWGVPSQQQIHLDASGSPAVVVYDLKGNPSPGISAGDVAGSKFGNPLPPTTLPETAATWVAMEPPSSWTTSTNLTIGLNVSEPTRSTYYQQPTVTNPANGIKDAYGPLDYDGHRNFLQSPLDASVGPLKNELLAGGTYANFRAVFVERLADPTRPYEPDPTSVDWNPYIAIDFMPIDLTVFNGESTALDPSETQGPDRLTPLGPLPLRTASNPGIEPAKLPLPLDTQDVLKRRYTYFHSRQRGFGVDLPNYDNHRTLFGAGTSAIQRNPHPFKPVGGVDDLKDTPLIRDVGAATEQQPGGRPTTPRSTAGLSASEKGCFLHELGQGPAGRTTASDWTKVPYHSLGWVNSSFGRRLDAGENIGGGNTLPASYAGVPDRPFPWLVWNDRPFANVSELIFVPMTPPGRLLSDYRNLDYPSGQDYSAVLSGTTYNPNDMYGACTPGAHLLPFTVVSDAAATGATRSRNADVFCRLFDLVRVRSPFVGTETVVTGTGNDGRSDRLVPPFNRAANYREPGRINVNTIPPDPPTIPTANLRERIWSAICADETNNTTPNYQKLMNSGTSPLNFQSGDLSAGNGLLTRPIRPASMVAAVTLKTGSNAPSSPVFAQSLLTNPRCTDSSAWFVNMPSGGSAPVPGIGDRFTARSFTLLRNGPPDPVTGAKTSLFSAPTADAWANDPDHNAWFRFETLVRAQTNATVRSEVYAIWVTMGLFEVVADGTQVFDPSNDLVPLYPDGYRLVREYGSDTGDITRHRAFYIFDRSVPVQYQSGTDNNVQDAILVERFIE